MLVFHHAIGDAMSGVYMIRDVIQALSNLFARKDPEYPPLPIRQSVESYFPAWSKGLSGILKHLHFLSYLLAKRMRLGKPYVPEQKRNVPPAQRVPFILHRSLPADIVSSLIRSARKKGTTIHGVLCAAYILALVIEGRLEKPRSFFLGTDINLREYLEPAMGEDVGFFITGILTLHSAGPFTGFWDLSRAIRSSIHERILKGDHFTGAKPVIRMTNSI